MSGRILRFVFSGGIITFFSMVCFYLLANFLGSTPYYFVACGILYFIISGINFLAQKVWVFSGDGSFFGFLLVNSCLALIFLVLQYFLKGIYGGEISGLIGVFFYLIISLFMFPLSFYFNKKVFWV